MIECSASYCRASPTRWAQRPIPKAPILRSIPSMQRACRSACSTKQAMQTDCIALQERTAFVWHGLILGIEAGPALRLSRGWAVGAGEGLPLQHEQAAGRSVRRSYFRASWTGRRRSFPMTWRAATTRRRTIRTSAAGVPKSVVVEHRFDWGDDCPPETPLSDSVIYEVHVKGFSKRNPERAGEAARHLCGAGASGQHRLPEGARHHRGGAAADPRDGGRRPSGGSRAARLLGLQHAGLLRAGGALFAPAATAAGRCASSRRWSRRCMRRASR